MVNKKGAATYCDPCPRLLDAFQDLFVHEGVSLREGASARGRAKHAGVIY